MKNPKLTAIVLLLSVSFLFSNCSQENLDIVSTTKEIISKGTWSVDYYYRDQDKTAQYITYHFTFNNDGTVTGKNGQEVFTGSWSTVTDVNRNDVLLMSITSMDPQLTELNTNWSVTGKDPQILAMKSGNNELRIKKQ